MNQSLVSPLEPISAAAVLRSPGAGEAGPGGAVPGAIVFAAAAFKIS